jgi:hypothetical protein
MGTQGYMDEQIARETSQVATHRILGLDISTRHFVGEIPAQGA